MDKSKIVLAVAPVLVAGAVAVTSTAATVDSGRITINKTATKVYQEADSNNLVYGRQAKVKLNVKANPYQANAKMDVVMVLDDSGSMAETMDGKETRDASQARIGQLKSAANTFIDGLMKDNDDGHIKVGAAIFSSSSYRGNDASGVDGYALTSSKSTAESYISNLRASGATNLQAGILKARQLLDNNANDPSRKSAKKVVLILSDGVPTAYTYESAYVGKMECGDLFRDAITKDSNVGDRDGVSRQVVQQNRYCPDDKPSDKAKDALDTLKQAYPDADVYTVRFNDEVNAKEELSGTLGKINPTAATSSHTYSNLSASGSADLLNKFQQSVSEVKLTAATDGVVTDTIPQQFELTAESQRQLTTSGVETVKNNDGSTTLTWRIGNIAAKENGYELSYVVQAKREYYGSIYTGAPASLNAVAAEDNPYKDYAGAANHQIKLQSEHPAVEIPAVANDDSYTDIPSYQGYADAKINGTSVLNNDLLKNKLANVSDSDKDAGVTSKLEVKTDANVQQTEDKNQYTIYKADVEQGTLTMQDDGKFTFEPASGITGEVQFQYHIVSSINQMHETNVVQSNDATVTLNIMPRIVRRIEIKGTFPEEKKLKVPEAVTIKLNADDETVKKDKVLVDDNKIDHSFDNVPVYEPEHENDDDNKIDYTVEQEKAKGFDTKITGDPDNGFTITNTPEKNEEDEPKADDSKDEPSDKPSDKPKDETKDDESKNDQANDNDDGDDKKGDSKDNNKGNNGESKPESKNNDKSGEKESDPKPSDNKRSPDESARSTKSDESGKPNKPVTQPRQNDSVKSNNDASSDKATIVAPNTGAWWENLLNGLLALIGIVR